ncbi:hypothetical protein PJM47_30780, partial [Mycobacterium kansasii]
HDSQMLNTIYQKIRNDLGTLNACVKDLRRSKIKGKTLYAKCTMSSNFTKYIDEDLRRRNEEVKALTDQLS